MCSRTEQDDGWRAKYGNDSRPWIITGTMDETPQLPSTMKESFRPLENLKNPVGPRRELLEKFLIKEVSEKLKSDMIKDPEEEEKISEYDGQFYIDGFDPSKPVVRTEKDMEDYIKHPLYNATGRTAWTDRLHSLEGTTQTSIVNKSSTAVFRKNASFTRPITEVLDIPKPGSIGYV